MLREEFLFDKRLYERLIKRGVVTREQFEEHLAQLPDAARKSEPLAVGAREEERDEEEAPPA